MSQENIRKLNKFSEDHYFRCVEGNTYVGYHVEGGDTLMSFGGKRLTMESLSDNRPLFLCNNPDEWWPGHLEDYDEFVIYEVTFEAPQGLEFSKYGMYRRLFEYSKNSYRINRKIKGLIEQGTHLYVLASKNDLDELSEGFLLYPQRYVKSIKVIRREEGIPL